MAAGDVSKYVVAPFGRNLGAGVFGDPNFGTEAYHGTPPPPGGFFRGNPYQITQDWYKTIAQGGFVAPETPQQNMANYRTTQRYFNTPTDLANWFGTGYGGNPSALANAYGRSNANFGGRDAQGNPLQANTSPLYQKWANDTIQAAQNPRLDALWGLTQMQGLNAGEADVNPQDWLSQQRGVENTGPSIGDATDPYLSRMRELAGSGLDQTRNVQNQYESDLIKNIDTQTNQSLANQLPEALSAASAAGVGRSGMGQRAAGDVYRSVVDQANRDKFSTLADFRNQAAAREAASIQQGVGIRGQGLQSAMDMAGQGTEAAKQRYTQTLQQALQAGFSQTQAQQQAERAALQSGAEWARQRYMFNSQQDLAALQAGDQSALNRMISQANAQSQGLGDYMNLFNTYQNTDAQRMQQMLAQSDQQRAIQNQILQQMLEAGQLPLNVMLQIATGVHPSNISAGNPSPWTQAGANALANYGASFFQGGGNQRDSNLPYGQGGNNGFF